MSEKLLQVGSNRPAALTSRVVELRMSINLYLSALDCNNLGDKIEDHTLVLEL